ncbi:uncharacterized protein BDZ83DRAFT_614889 [Colletotrichum acutatum]|uniref:Uncharacterized protein n=1 Tax=Glomerella acutata TaxID=27357 RepID=A0AAD8UV28_GLOAC|nr:uncharacterized protein BDZ83DRAFT_614889 [Colletotrichum acutatum]KAK1726835.1 hypothetical protein BDZ83DRAFT_614889 [Colletotrichum acutatum]
MALAKVLLDLRTDCLALSAVPSRAKEKDSHIWSRILQDRMKKVMVFVVVTSKDAFNNHVSFH